MGRTRPNTQSRGWLSRLLLLTLAGLLWMLVLAGRIELTGRRDDDARADAVVVLEAAQYRGMPSPVFAARLDHALALYEEGKAPLVIVAGGREDGDRYTEAAAGVRYLNSNGVPAGKLLAVGRGDDTLSSLQAVAAAARRREISSVLLVSDRFHMERSLRMATDLGLRAYGSPTTTSPVEEKPASRLRYTLREVAALMVYLLSPS